MWDFPYINLLVLITSLVSFIAPVIMVAFICTRIFLKFRNLSDCSKETIRKQGNNDYLISENVDSNHGRLSTNDHSPNRSNVDIDNYFERRKKSKRIYFTFIPKVKGTLSCVIFYFKYLFLSALIIKFLLSILILACKDNSCLLFQKRLKCDS